MTKPSASEPILWPALILVGAQVSFNFGATFAKGLFLSVGPEGVAALRTSIAAMLLLAVWRPWRTRVRASEIPFLLAYGAMLGLMNLFIYRAFELIPIGVATGIEVIGPLTLVLLSSRRITDFVWLASAVFGLCLLLPLRHSATALNPVGMAYALGAAISWALYIVLGKRVSALGNGPAVSWGMLVAATVNLPLGIAHAGMALLTPSALLIGLVVAVLSSALPYSMEMVSLQHLSRRVFSILISSSPAIGAVIAFCVLGERLSFMQWIAISCIICACVGSAVMAPQNVALEQIEEAQGA